MTAFASWNLAKSCGQTHSLLITDRVLEAVYDFMHKFYFDRHSLVMIFMPKLRARTITIILFQFDV